MLANGWINKQLPVFYVSGHGALEPLFLPRGSSSPRLAVFVLRELELLIY